MTTQALVTVALPFPSDRVDHVDAALRTLDDPDHAAIRTALDKTGIVHFISLSVVPDTAPGRADLVLELCADAGPEEALTAVCRVLQPGLGDALEAAGFYCIEESIMDCLLRHSLRLGTGWGATPGLGFTGAPGMSVWRIL